MCRAQSRYRASARNAPSSAKPRPEIILTANARCESGIPPAPAHATLTRSAIERPADGSAAAAPAAGAAAASSSSSSAAPAEASRAPSGQAKSAAKKEQRAREAVERYSVNNFGDYFSAAFPPKALVRHADGTYEALTQDVVAAGLKNGTIRYAIPGASGVAGYSTSRAPFAFNEPE